MYRSRQQGGETLREQEVSGQSALWHPSRKTMNKLVHILNGNGVKAAGRRTKGCRRKVGACQNWAFDSDNESLEEAKAIGMARLIEDAGREDVRDLRARAVGLGDRDTLRMLDAGLGGIIIDLEGLECKVGGLSETLSSMGTAMSLGVARLVQIEQNLALLEASVQDKVASMVELSLQQHTDKLHQRFEHAQHLLASFADRLQQQHQETHGRFADLEARGVSKD